MSPIVKIGGNTHRLPKMLTGNAAAPTVNDDITNGHVVGDIWVSDQAAVVFRYWCEDNTAGAAIWQRYLSSAGSLASPTKVLDWDRDPSSGPPEVLSGDILVFEFQDGGPIRGVISAINYPFGSAPVTNPIVVIPFFVTSTGAGDDDAVFRLNVKYIATGELSTKANDETLDQTVAVTDTLDSRQQMTYTLDKSLISSGDYVSLRLERIHSDPADTYSGNIGIAEIGEFDAGT